MVNVFRRIMLVTAFLLTILIFSVGLYVGYLLDDMRVDDADSLILNTDIETDSFVIQSDFFEAFEVSDCTLLSSRMQKLGNDLGEIGNTLARYDSKKISKGDYYNQLKRKYFLLEITAYTIRKQLQD